MASVNKIMRLYEAVKPTRGVASQKVMEGQAYPTKHSKSFMIAKKANDPMVG